ncbi:LacI family DNA-binding transcriptional regulator [Pectinatus cerevisiiphilus]|uniref:LacI family transcriptional regulator n=1 Tax=Pectinatus cerevisiiphilus TaxID=86956 RepID=A0A4R3KD85_9FIRM|nr:LacI family DNA-binding transcriptional regulator [Pectinatus cerevisiiphilus]TCS80899.1 LacI family transcriptional regulator [Pectinatus cerevisiiphilus]
MVTIKQIADLCGVSRGTVDRVINERGNVKTETRNLVLNMIKKLEYQPNPAGKALSARKHNPVVGILIPAKGNPFFDDVIRGIKTAAEKYKIYGLNILLHSIRGYSTEAQLQILAKLKGKINALIINPINDPLIINKINEFVDSGVFVVTLNNDADESRRHCYVGTNYVNGGETAGALLQMITKEKANIGIIMGSSKVLGHRQRLEGFKYNINKNPDFKIVDIQENDDDDICSYDKTKEMIMHHPEINVLFIVAAGVYGACRAVLALNKQDQLTILAFDTVPTTVEMMKKHIIKAVIYQHPYRQGQRAMQLVFEYLVNGISPDKSKHIMKNEIKILENL